MLCVLPCFVFSQISVFLRDVANHENTTTPVSVFIKDLSQIAESKIRAGWNVAFKHVLLACPYELRIDGRSSLLANATGYSHVHIAPEDLPVGLRGTVRDTQDAQFQRRPVSFSVKQLRFIVSIE
ncbi:hypothetical protein DPMN_042877 [Dreissena polymorpha]|uniref:Uncharacterized protein n=1 Tax=Dreissena polymorpha TaxID=45954 RepID=A0A9D4HXA6_DREPO|nr:hypothetical protein DPMN_042877 [Dreissena polymorpha]